MKEAWKNNKIPAGIFAIAECYTHDLNEMRPGPVPFNLRLYYLFFALLLFLTGRPAAAISIEADCRTAADPF